jgi:hypothetical protein
MAVNDFAMSLIYLHIMHKNNLHQGNNTLATTQESDNINIDWFCKAKSSL